MGATLSADDPHRAELLSFGPTTPQTAVTAGDRALIAAAQIFRLAAAASSPQQQQQQQPPAAVSSSSSGVAAMLAARAEFEANGGGDFGSSDEDDDDDDDGYHSETEEEDEDDEEEEAAAAEPRKAQRKPPQQAQQKDGYRWRKYGQKAVPGAPGQTRNYYKCMQQGCAAKKVVLRGADGAVLETAFRGEHGHASAQPSAAEQRISAADQSAFRSTVGEGVLRGGRLVVQSRVGAVDAMDDGFSWRKYGQKKIGGNAHPKSYYRCTAPGCCAKKSVERAGDDAIVVYEGSHTHPAPEQPPHKRPRR